MTIEDVNKLLGYTGEKGQYKHPVNGDTLTPEAKTIAELEKELGISFSFRETPDGKDLGKYKSDLYVISNEDNVTYPDHKAYVYYSFDKASDIYWLASNCVFADFTDMYVYSALRCVYRDQIGMRYIYKSWGGGYDGDGALRPVVSLNSNVRTKLLRSGRYTRKVYQNRKNT